MEEDKDTKPSAKLDDPFLLDLQKNQVAQARSALLQTIQKSPGRTIGGILDALETDEAGDHIMLDLFRRLSVAELAEALDSPGHHSSAVVPAVKAADCKTADDEFDDDEFDDDEFDDDDEFGDDDSDLDDEAAPKKIEKAPKKKKGKKKKGKKKKGKKGSDSSPDKDVVGDLSEKGIIRCLRTSRAVDEESAMTSQEIRKEIGGSADDIRPLLGSLLEDERIDTVGKARGTRYFLLPKK